MNRTQERARAGRPIAPLVRATIVACSVIAACASEGGEWPDGRVMFERASSELEGIEGHPWAGLYRGAGLFGDEWAVAPETGVVQHHKSWCANCAWYGYWGPIDTATEECITLRFDGVQRGEEGDSRLPDPRLHLVRWQDLLFLIPPEGIEGFCSDYSDGSSLPPPRSAIWERTTTSTTRIPHDRRGDPTSRPRIASSCSKRRSRAR